MRRLVWAFEQRWPGRAGTPAANCCACSPVTPSSSSIAATAHSQAGQPVDRRTPAARRPGPGLRRDRPGDPGRRGPGLPGPAARAVRGARRGSCPTRSRSSTWARTTGCATPTPGPATTAASTPAPGPTGCPSCPASGPRSPPRRGWPAPAATRWRPSLALAPLIAAGVGTPRRRRGGRRLRHLRRGPGRQGPPARQRGDGRPVALQGGRAPARAGDQAGHRRDRPVVHAGARADAAGHPGHRHRRAAPATPTRARCWPPRTPTSRSCTCCPRGRGRTPPPPPARTPAPAGDRGRRLGAGDRGQRDRQPRQGRRRPGRAERQPDAGLPGDRRPVRRLGWRHERHRPPVASAPPASPPG